MKMRREVKIGLFALLMMFALYAGINFIKGSDIFSGNTTYYAEYEQVNGVQKASAIMVKGYKVGVISDIIFDPQRSDKIVLEFSIKSKFRIPDNSKARVYSDGLLGGKAVEIEMGDSPRYLEKGDTLRSEMDKGLFDTAGSDIELMKQKAGQLVNDLSTTLANINIILEGNRESLSATMNNLAHMSSTLNSVVQGQSASLSSLIANLNRLSATLGDNAHRVENIMGNVEDITGSLAEADFGTMAGNLSSALDEFNKALAGDGSLGKLMHDDSLYNSLNEAAGNLSNLIEQIGENPGPFVSLSVFGPRAPKKK